MRSKTAIQFLFFQWRIEKQMAHQLSNQSMVVRILLCAAVVHLNACAIATENKYSFYSRFLSIPSWVRLFLHTENCVWVGSEECAMKRWKRWCTIIIRVETETERTKIIIIIITLCLAIRLRFSDLLILIHMYMKRENNAIAHKDDSHPMYTLYRNRTKIDRWRWSRANEIKNSENY